MESYGGERASAAVGCMMNEIKIFISSSTVEFERERKDLGNFIRSLDNFFKQWGVRLELTVCEDLSKTIQRKRMQETYNERIRESHFQYVLVGRDVGVYVREEFEVGLANFQKTGFPKICTWFQEPPEGGRDSESVTAFKARIEEIDHYYHMYEHLDTIKLSMLFELLRFCADADMLEFLKRTT